MLITPRSLLWPAAPFVLVVLAACGKAPEQASAPPPPPNVEVVTVQPRALALSSDLPGRIEAVRVAEVRARVPGIVLSRHFREGADVKAGELLFRIDPAPLKATLARAQAELARTDAAVFDAQAVVRRYTPLVEIEAVSKQDFDAAQTALKSAQAARQSAQADVETARLNLDYATVKAPIAGRIGRALVTEGALVGQNETTAMATIQQLDPVYADFKQPVADMLRLREARKGQGTVPISITVDGTEHKRDGELLFSDITVDRGTGQVSLRGQFANPDGMLLPGMYVRVHTGQGTEPAAILVPQRAVQRSGDGTSSVLLVGKEEVVESRTVRMGAMQGGEWQVKEGLQGGERVIVSGAASARPGQKVTVAAPPAPSAPAASSTATGASPT